jgi:hypothetical protein
MLNSGNIHQLGYKDRRNCLINVQKINKGRVTSMTSLLMPSTPSLLRIFLLVRKNPNSPSMKISIMAKLVVLKAVRNII